MASFRVTVFVCSFALVVVVAGGMLGAWAYLELEHIEDQRELVDCIRTETLADGAAPAMQVVEASIMQCQD